MDNKDLVEKITQEVMARLKNETPQQSKENNDLGITVHQMARYIDHTLLKPEATVEQHEKLVKEALEYDFYSVCVNSSWVEYVAKKLRGTNTKVCSVVGFPLGEMDSRAKAFETQVAIEKGAHEIDMVIPVGAIKSGDYKYLENDIRAVKRVCRSNTVLKVILETSLLNDEQKIAVCEICKKVDVDFVKTSTGFGSGGATVADIELMRRTVGSKMGVKASGGIRDFATAVAMIRAGATRIGAGASVAIVTGGKSAGNY